MAEPNAQNAQVPPAGQQPNAAGQQQGAAEDEDVDFSLVPGSVAGILDYSSRQGLAIFSQATRSLYEDPADLFNVESSGLQTFLALLQLRGNTCGWDFEVPRDNAQPDQNLAPFLSEHGQFSMDHLRTFCQSYVNNQTRAAQDNMQMVKCIISSLTLPGFRKIQVWHDTWHVQGTPAALLLIKVIIREAFIDTQATTRILREHLSSLPDKLEEFKGDIDQLNAFVKVTQDQLSARGETTHDLLANLFKGYLSSRDINFQHYIEKKQEDYDDGTVFTVDGLMNQASNKFKTLVQAGKWLAPTDEQAKILALEAKVNKFGKKSSSPTQTGSSKQNSSNSNSGKSSGKKGNKEVPAWKTKYPGRAFIDGNKTKVRDGRTYWWCKKHKRFCMHQTSDCRLPSPQGSSGRNRNSSSIASPVTSSDPSSPSITVSAVTLMEE